MNSWATWFRDTEGPTSPPPLPEGDAFVVVTKVGVKLPMSAEMYPVHIESGTERAYRESLACEEWRARRAAQQQAYAVLWSDLLTMAEVDQVQSSGAVMAVLQLHAPVEDRYVTMACGVCQDGDMDRMPWPCATVETIAGVYGISIPELIR